MDAFIGGVLAVNYEVIIWVTVMAIAIILEISTVNLITIWFGIGAVVAILLSYCGVPMPVQIVVFFIVSFACMLILKPLRDNLIKGKGKTLDSLVGRKCLISKIPDTKGMLKVKINGVDWNAEIYEKLNGIDISNNVYDVDMPMYIMEVNGNTLVVSDKPPKND